MKIERVEWFILKVPLKRPVLSSLGVIAHRQVLLLQILCDNGLAGWGEAYMNFPLWGSRDRANLLQYEIKPRLIGMKAHPSLSRTLSESLALTGIQWGASGLVSQVLSAVDIAIWDIVARFQEVPVWKLFNDKEKEFIQAYASGVDQQDLESTLTQLASQGFTAFKVRVGFGNDNDKKAIKKARSILGRENLLMIDANQKWSLEQAVEMIEALEPYSLTWVEEPIRADELEGLAQITRKFPSIQLAAGENVYGARDFSFLSDTIPYIQPDITKQGGFTGLNSILKITRNKGRRLIPHYYGSAIGMAATLHYIAGLQDEDCPLEFDSFQNPLIEEIVEGFPLVKDGKVKIPLGPGLGVVPKEDFIRRHLELSSSRKE